MATVMTAPASESLRDASHSGRRSASVRAPVNIAVVKYWGKRDNTLNLPANSSISLTLSAADLCTHTTAVADANARFDTLSLNDGPPEPITNCRTNAVIGALRLARAQVEAQEPHGPALATLPLRIKSKNNFPTAAGIASSASGYAALVSAVAAVYSLPENLADLSRIARQGSGSACRSLHGGFVEWHTGHSLHGEDSVAQQLAPANHWADLRATILVASDKSKAVGSSEGMSRTAATSNLFQHRIAAVVPAQLPRMRKALAQRDWELFARVTVEESNSLHATCADSFPPIWYMDETSRAVVRAVEVINARAGYTAVCYTFDAGPNAVLFYRSQDASLVTGALAKALPSLIQSVGGGTKEDQGLPPHLVATLGRGISRVINTCVGGGVEKVGDHVI